MNENAVLEDARKRWAQDGPRFAAFGRIIEKRCREEVLRLGVMAEVSSRPKEMGSLIKKLMVRSEYTYDSLPDKVGVRVIVRFQREITRVLDNVAITFCRGPIDYKVNDLGDDRVGYVSAHAELALRPDHPNTVLYPPEQFRAELQVRTLAQHLWSEMAHDTVYKNSAPVASDIRRRTNLMAGLIEVADNEFSRIESELSGQQGSGELSVLKALERQFYRLCARRTNPELSLAVIRLLAPLYDCAGSWEAHFEAFFEQHEAVLRCVLDRADHDPELHSPLLFQPEMLMIYDLIKTTPWTVRRAWNQQFPDRELEQLANELGEALE